ncbi:2'-5' RNA ligase family protein [Sphingomonas lenta]|uniref:2'-5' RNA ligase n=1 Tax=Sphingomonas lenta TaxID=1141887 RepID=A0A2A2SCF9_9SPHN|nr:2'-5' RNA ligase family protein [Sphingomonas lenta]PAX06862.1 hypothetical protein CKY28_12345 [Sphingomonas lenta]
MPFRVAPRPLYVMIKPPPPLADHLHAAFGPTRRPDLLHMTMRPLGDRAAFAGSELDRLRRLLDRFRAPPFRVALDRLGGDGERLVLHGSEPIRGVLRFQRALARLLAAHGFGGRYAFRPHVTLAYGQAPRQAHAVDVVSWTAHDYLLVESVVGEARHELLGRWPLTP